jgi:beta-galactosidase
MSARPWIWGTFVWNGFDFGVDSRKEGDHPGRNDKGLVTYDRKTPKDAYRFYQANWTSAPMVAIASRRFSPRPAGETTVTLYSNCEKVELFQDGKSLGAQQPDGLHRVHFRVNLTTGTSNLRASGSANRKRVTDQVRWKIR